jgi:hypothetical protein
MIVMKVMYFLYILYILNSLKVIVRLYKERLGAYKETIESITSLSNYYNFRSFYNHQISFIPGAGPT